MNILLMTLNSKFIHSNLALHYIEKYWQAHYSDQYPEVQLTLREYTINNEMDDILRNMHRGHYDCVFVSAYIWNIDSLRILLSNYVKINPHIYIFLGGPEVSYNPLDQLEQYPFVSGVVCGEGEEIFAKVVETLYLEKGIETLHKLPHVATRKSTETPLMARVENLDKIPFPYEDRAALENRIIYYESSRGCPYACAYCLSSASNGVRFFSLDRVYEDLKQFLDWNVPQVKFVDRTFNVNKNHALSIMRYVVENDNGITNFHFEINADLLDASYIEVIQSGRKGLFQFEIGIQSTNSATTDAINRPIVYEALKRNTLNLIQTQKTHVHVDLIAGLPFESYVRFLRSFDDVFSLGADQLQLGFLKLLKGTPLYKNQELYGYKVRDEAPFELLENKFISYDELSKLKEMEKLVEWYHNSGKFVRSLKWLIKKMDTTPSDFFNKLSRYFQDKHLFDAPLSTYRLYQVLDSFYKVYFSDLDFFNDLLKYDYYASNMHGQRELFSYTEIQGLNKKRLLLLNESAFVKMINPNLVGMTPKQMLKQLEFVTFRYDINKLIESGYKDVQNEICVMVFDSSNPEQGIKLDFELFKGDDS